MTRFEWLCAAALLMLCAAAICLTLEARGARDEMRGIREQMKQLNVYLGKLVD